SDLRGELNARMRPEIAELASGFLADLTDGRYDELELTEDYTLTILEGGVPKPVISGGEEDIASLVLRLAISQMIAERAGQPLSLLVLDEIFGSLDEVRRLHVVGLLRRLADRFPQVILITHIEQVREGLDRVIRVDFDPARAASVVRDDTATLGAADAGVPARPPGRGGGEDHRADGARLATRAGRGDPGSRDHAPDRGEHRVLRAARLLPRPSHSDPDQRHRHARASEPGAVVAAQERGERPGARGGARPRRGPRSGLRLHSRDPADRGARPRRHVARRRRRRTGRADPVALGAARRGSTEGRGARAQARGPGRAHLRCRDRGDRSRRGPRWHPAGGRAMPDPLRRRCPPARGPR